MTKTIQNNNTITKRQQQQLPRTKESGQEVEPTVSSDIFISFNSHCPLSSFTSHNKASHAKLVNLKQNRNVKQQ